MIHLDTDALVALPLWAREGHPTIQRIAEGEPAAVCALVWYEFVIGPVEQSEIELAHAFLQGRIVGIDEQDATLAATLFKGADRKRPLKTDALIAAAAIRANALFVTINTTDFEPFVPYGLRLMPVAD